MATEILKSIQPEQDLINKYKGIKVYLYNCIEGKVYSDYKTFYSINDLSKNLSIARETISLYLNTYVPYKDNLFLTDATQDTDLLEKW